MTDIVEFEQRGITEPQENPCVLHPYDSQANVLRVWE